MKKRMNVLMAMGLAASMIMSPVAAFAEEAAASDGAKWTEEETPDGWVKITQDGGETLGYSADSGVSIITVDGYAFKDLDRDGELDTYEDWREDDAKRTEDLVSKMTIDQKMGLRINDDILSLDPNAETTTNHLETGTFEDEITEWGYRYVLSFPHGSTMSLNDLAKWNNKEQALCETTELGIPLMINCNPSTDYEGGMSNLAMAATFNTDLVSEMIQKASDVYRASGVTMVLGPQMDLATDPRSESYKTYGEDPQLSKDMANAVVSAYQSTYDEEGNDLGWGDDSVVTQMKHFAANYANEGGRFYHYFYGEYTVFPGNQFETQLVPFVEGAMALDSTTGQSGAAMVTYTIPYSEDGSYGDLVGGAFNEYMVGLLDENGYEGMVSTDGLIYDEGDGSAVTTFNMDTDKMSVAEQVYAMFSIGIDQIMSFQYNIDDVREAYNMMVEKDGQEAADQNFTDAAYATLLPMFETGLFENPYRDTTESATVEKENEMRQTTVNDYTEASVVMLKNNGVITENTSDEKKTVYVPYVERNGSWELPVDQKALNETFNVVTDTLDGEEVVRASEDDIKACDMVLAIVNSPATGTGYDEEAEKYIPISLQYSEYTADSSSVRQPSIAGDEVTVETESPYGIVKTTDKEDRSYYGESTVAENKSDMEMVQWVSGVVGDSVPVVVAVNSTGAMIFSELEQYADAILVGFQVDTANFLAIADGKYEPTALLPVQMPADMETVEAQCEDVPRDCECYTDENGNTYDFAFGMNWSGVINDERVEKYNVEPQVGLSK